MKTLSIFFLCAFTMICSLLPGQAQANEACLNPGMATSDAPANRPVTVEIGVIFNDILGVSDPGQYIETDLALIMQWTDPRLARFEGCFLNYASIWTPRIELLNSSNLKPKYTQSRNQVEILKGGKVRYLQRLTGTISTYHQLRKFPFDKQTFEFELFSVAGGIDTVQLAPLNDRIFVSKRLNIEDWSFGEVKGLSTTRDLPSFDTTSSILRIDLEAHRHIMFYVFKVIVPLFLIVSMSWIVFWIPPEKFETQVGFGATSMLTLIAFQFGMVNNIPKLDYFTSMDYMVLGATVLVYAAMVQALITGVLYRLGYEKRMQWVEINSRWLFPALLLIIWTWIVHSSTS